MAWENDMDNALQGCRDGFSSLTGSIADMRQDLSYRYNQCLVVAEEKQENDLKSLLDDIGYAKAACDYKKKRRVGGTDFRAMCTHYERQVELAKSVAAEAGAAAPAAQKAEKCKKEMRELQSVGEDTLDDALAQVLQLSVKIEEKLRMFHDNSVFPEMKPRLADENKPRLVGGPDELRADELRAELNKKIHESFVEIGDDNEDNEDNESPNATEDNESHDEEHALVVDLSPPASVTLPLYDKAVAPVVLLRTPTVPKDEDDDKKKDTRYHPYLFSDQALFEVEGVHYRLPKKLPIMKQPVGRAPDRHPHWDSIHGVWRPDVVPPKQDFRNQLGRIKSGVGPSKPSS